MLASALKSKTLSIPSVVIYGHPGEPYFDNLESHMPSLSVFWRLVEAVSPKCFVDVGANIGVTTAGVHKLAPDCRVIAVEPSQRAFTALSMTAPRAELVNALIGEADGEAGFLEAGDLSASHRSEFAPRLPMRRLDTLLSEMDAQPDLIKIDVEGFEFGVLEGLPTTGAVVAMELNAFTISTYGKISPIILLEKVRQMAGGFYGWDGSQMVWHETDGELATFLHRCMIDRGCCDDVYFSASEAGRAQIAATT